MEFSSNFNGKKRKIKFFIGILLIILVIFGLNFFQKNTKTFFYSISQPFQKFFWQIGDNASDFFESIIKNKNLKNELNGLKIKNNELLSEIVFLRELKKENEVLKRALELNLEKDYKLLLSQITAKDISSDFILINKGKSEGVSENMPVITQERVLLGRVGEVYEKFSKVMLITDKKSSFDAKIFILGEEKKDVSGVVKGKGNLKIYLDFISKDMEIKPGDLITSTNIGGVFPDNLLVGQIENIIKKDTESFQQADIKPAFNITDLSYLFVITNY